MELIVGGAFQGKGEFAKECLGVKEEHIRDHLEHWIRQRLSEGKKLEELYDLLEEQMKKDPQTVFILAEVGCGIVPIEEADRQYREVCGRVGCYLAKKAEKVYRVQCKIGMVIKDESHATASSYDGGK